MERDWEQMRKAARSDPDCCLMDRKACQVPHHLLPATSRLGGCHGKRPFSTIGDKRGHAPAKVNRRHRQGRDGVAVLPPSPHTVIKIHPEEAGASAEFLENANEMLICWTARNER